MFSPAQSVLLKAPYACREARLASVNRNFSGDRRQKGSEGSLRTQPQRGLLSNDQLEKFLLIDSIDSHCFIRLWPWMPITQRCIFCREIKMRERYRTPERAFANTCSMAVLIKKGLGGCVW